MLLNSLVFLIPLVDLAVFIKFVKTLGDVVGAKVTKCRWMFRLKEDDDTSEEMSIM